MRVKFLVSLIFISSLFLISFSNFWVFTLSGSQASCAGYRSLSLVTGENIKNVSQKKKKIFRMFSKEKSAPFSALFFPIIEQVFTGKRHLIEQNIVCRLTIFRRRSVFVEAYIRKFRRFQTLK
jgi:hypothetical protein